jgi:hypothetical protein
MTWLDRGTSIADAVGSEGGTAEDEPVDTFAVPVVAVAVAAATADHAGVADAGAGAVAAGAAKAVVEDAAAGAVESVVEDATAASAAAVAAASLFRNTSTSETTSL